MSSATVPQRGETLEAKASRATRHWALALTVASGFCSLGYQIVWTQQTALWLGHETVAVLAVVAAFFGGLALGALALGPRVERSASPARWYAGCEAVIGLWSVALAFLMPTVTGWLFDLIGVQPSILRHWSVAFFGTFLLLLPATIAMGATLPAMERVLAWLRERGASVAILYAGNTAGAVLGVLVTAFVLIPQFGLVQSASICAMLNLLCAVATLRFVSSPRDVPREAPSAGRSSTQIFLAVTGLLGIGYEVLVVRVLSQVAEDTVYTFAIILAVYLSGTSVGAAIYGRRRFVAPDAMQVRDRLTRMLACACLIGVLALANAEAIKASVLHTFGSSMTSALATETMFALAAFLLPTIVMGALFTHVTTTARAEGIGFGRALGVNMLGATMAPLLFGVVLLPYLGPKFSLLLIACAYLALSSSRGWTARTQWLVAGLVAVLCVWTPSLAIVDIPEGGRIVSYTEGALATVSVIEDARGVSRLHINNRQQEGSSDTLLSDARQALLPLLLHPAPRRALFLGLGTGITASVAAEDPMLQVDAVELLPEVIDASAYFTRELNGGAFNPRLHLMSADARRYVRASNTRYDVIVSDNFHPARSGSGSLYTVEHFAAVRNRLAEGGVFCQWLPLHQMDLNTLRSVVHSFVSVYPKGWAMLATNSLETPVLGLVARADAEGFDVDRARDRLHERLSAPTTTHHPVDLGIADEFALLGSVIAGPRALARFAGSAPLNTDDHPVVTYMAPRITYVNDSLPRDRLIALLHEVTVDQDELVVLSPDEYRAPRLSAYWKARDRFIEAGRDVQATSDVRRMLTQVQAPLLAVLRISPDFRPAYDPLLRMATALGPLDAPAARALLTQLRDAQPARPDAAQALRNLASASP